jgi:hypothetical protein
VGVTGSSVAPKLGCTVLCAVDVDAGDFAAVEAIGFAAIGFAAVFEEG